MRGRRRRGWRRVRMLGGRMKRRADEWLEEEDVESGQNNDGT